MLNTALEFLPKYKYDYFNSFLDKFLLLTSKDDYNEVMKKFQLIKKYSLIEKYEEKIEALEIFILQKQIAKITLSSNKTLAIKPLRFDWKKDKATLYYININNNEEERINLDIIVKIATMDEQNYIIQEEEIIFELYGSLAKRYLLKKDERIVKSTKNTLTVASSEKNKEALFKRLLRYDTLCRVLFPKKEVERFNKLLDTAIINLDIQNIK